MSGPFGQILARYGWALGETGGWIVCVAALSALLCFWRPRIPRAPAWAFGLLLVGLALVWAWQLRWLCDDAYIAFRYARNLAQGQGPIFNLGERVEGYTSFLWVLLAGGAIRLGLDPGQVSIVLGMGCFAAALWLTARLAAGTNEPSCLPIAALVLGANYTFASFATSGLETMTCALLILLSLERALAGRPLAAGLFGIAAVLGHPDHAILYVCLGVALALTTSGAERRRTLVQYALPFLLVYVPYFLWRLRYYGDFFPNTYYAKSAGLAYFEQGRVYLFASLVGGGLFGALPLFAVGLYVDRRSLLGRFVLLAFPLYLLYVAKIGGDFMFGRLLVTLLPLCFLFADRGARRLLAAGRTRLAFAGLLALGFAALPTRIIRPHEKFWHLADERTVYPLVSFVPIRVESYYLDLAELLWRNFPARGLHPQVATPCTGFVGYFTGLPVIDLYGLTDRTVGHQVLTVRSRPGHEKRATQPYLTGRGVAFSTAPIYWGRHAPLATLRVEGEAFQLLRWDATFLDGLRGRSEISFIDLPKYLDEYLVTAADLPPAVVRDDLAFFRAFYFDHNRDPERLARLEQIVRGGG